MAREDRTRFFFYERAADDMVFGIDPQAHRTANYLKLREFARKGDRLTISD